jgi:hypothetical protein
VFGYMMRCLLLSLGIPLAVLRCIGFLDGTLRPICRPSRGQRACYNGKDRVHGLKYLAISDPTGLVLYMYGPIEGRHHDSYLVLEGRLHELLGRAFPDRTLVFADSAFALHRTVLPAYRSFYLDNPASVELNRAISSVRIGIEWAFKHIAAEFAFLSSVSQQRVLLMPLAKHYRVATLLSNAITSLYGNQTSSYFQLRPVSLQEYFAQRPPRQ